MPERDPFGRLPGEDTLAGLGSPSDGIVAQPTAETTAPAPTAGDAPQTPGDVWRQPAAPPVAEADAAEDRTRPQRGTRGRAARRAPRVVRWIVVAVSVLVVLNVASALLIGTAEVTVEGGSEVTRPADGPDPVGLQPRSMLLRANLAPALRRLRTGGLGQLQTLRIAPERVDATLLTRAGKLRFVQVRSDGRLRRLSLSGGGFDRIPTIPFAEVDAAAPARLARSAAGRSKRPVSQVDYVVRLNAGTDATWSVVMRRGGQFVGDARGIIIRRIG